MTDSTFNGATGQGLLHRRVGHHTTDAARARLRRRYRTEAIFKWCGIFGIGIALAMLATLLITTIVKAIPAFTQTYIELEIYLDPEVIDPAGTREQSALRGANYQALANDALYAFFPDVTGRTDRRDMRGMVSPGFDFDMRQRVMADPDLVGQTLIVRTEMQDKYDQLNKGLISRDPEGPGRPLLSEQELSWYDALHEAGMIERGFNSRFFTGANSRQPELAGIGAALIGSLYLIAVTLGLSFPIGVAAAIYLEEFAPKNRLTDLIEVNINNLAAVPSIVFGLLGLAVFIQFFGLPDKSPLVGGMVIALMTLPTIIIASRAALKAVPPSIREGALGMGASKQQVILHHTLPLAMPGILTGSIIGMAQALGETAPLLLVGMTVFRTGYPSGITDSSNVLPIQIYDWWGNPERGFDSLAAAAIIVLLTFLIAMNALAIWMRRRFERRW